MTDSPRIVGAVMGAPFDRRTWSGASYHLFSALRRAGALAGAVDASPPAWLHPVAKAAAVAPNLQRWRERYEYSPLVRRAAARAGASRMAAIEEQPDAILQVGAYYDFTRHVPPRPRLRCSFHDANLALYSRLGPFVRDPQARHIRSMWRHEQRVFDGLDLIFPMSAWLRQSFLEDFGQDPDKVVVVGTGVNVLRLPAPVERDWSRLRLLYVGFDWERKGGPGILEAFRVLRARQPEATLTVVGPTRPAEVPEGVDWVGPVDRSTPEGDVRMEQLHREATAFVLLPSYDPMPNAVLEAMSWGLPVVAPDRGSMPEMVGETGVLLEDTSAEAVAAELGTLPERAARLGGAARQRVHDRFTWDHVAHRMLTAIDARLGS